VRNAIHALNKRGLDALEPGTSRPKRTLGAFNEESAERLREMLHRSPREFGRETSLWTLEMAAEVSFEEGSQKGGSRGRRPSLLLCTFSESAGREPSDGSPLHSPYTNEKRRREKPLEVAATASEWAEGYR
jgi:hypothetical protein